jgi:NAD+-dependent protein deacetylase sirtuin 2
MDAVLKKLREGCKVVVLTGAGVSCAAGIPDFRSPGGLYSTLKPDLITATEQQRDYMRFDPTAVVDIRLFSVNQFPYLEVRRPFILGTAEMKWKATLSHFFMQVLHDKGMLQRIYSQNIDGLDFQLSVPKEKIVNLHGSLGEIKCEFCGANHSVEKFREDVRNKIKNIYATDSVADTRDGPVSSTNIFCSRCQRPGVKPATVMYGSDLPRLVFQRIREDFPGKVDLLIVAGTSLTVSPACNLVSQVSKKTPRLLVNQQVVGQHLGMSFGTVVTVPPKVGSPVESGGTSEDKDLQAAQKETTFSVEEEEALAPGGGTGRDVAFQGDCDTGFATLAAALGWLEELAQYQDRMCDSSRAVLQVFLRSQEKGDGVEQQKVAAEVTAEVAAGAAGAAGKVGSAVGGQQEGGRS